MVLRNIVSAICLLEDYICWHGLLTWCHVCDCLNQKERSCCPCLAIFVEVPSFLLVCVLKVAADKKTGHIMQAPCKPHARSSPYLFLEGLRLPHQLMRLLLCHTPILQLLVALAQAVGHPL